MGANLGQTKVIQTKVILGKGTADFFKELDFEFPMGKELYKIEKIKKWIDVYDVRVVDGNKVIFNAWVYKNIAYKTATYVDTDKKGTLTVTGDIRHITKRVELAGFIDITPEYGCKIKENGALAEVLEAEVIGEVEDLLCPMPIRKYPPYPTMEGLELDGKDKDKEYMFKPPVKNYCEEEPVYVYGKLHEKMVIRIKVKVVEWEHFPVRVAGCGTDKE